MLECGMSDNVFFDIDNAHQRSWIRG